MHTTRRKVQDRDDAVELLNELEASGLEIRKFCAGRGIDGRSLHCWRTNLRGDLPTSRRQVRLVELTPAARPTPITARYRVVVGDLAVEVDDAFHEDTLARLLAVVARC